MHSWIIWNHINVVVYSRNDLLYKNQSAKSFWSLNSVAKRYFLATLFGRYLQYSSSVARVWSASRNSTVIRYKPDGVWLHFNPAELIRPSATRSRNMDAWRVPRARQGGKRTARLCDAVKGKRRCSFSSDATPRVSVATQFTVSGSHCPIYVFFFLI